MGERQSVRINKFISETGYCSRREADNLLRDKRVTINGEVAELGAVVSAGDVVTVDGDILSSHKKEKLIYIALNKPVGIVCTTDSNERNNIVNFIGHDKRIFPIGRLDKDSDGLIFLTNDGDIVNKILRAGNQHEKTYIVSVNKAINAAFIKGMAEGVPILGKKTQKCEVEFLGKYQFRIVLTQGLNRQIRRMCQHFGYDVKSLTRTQIMNIKLDMPVGKWRNLSKQEVDELQLMVSDSSKMGAVLPKKSSKKNPVKATTSRKTNPKKNASRSKQNKDAGFNPKSKALRKSGKGRRR